MSDLKRFALLPLLAALALPLAGCGGAEEPGGAGAAGTTAGPDAPARGKKDRGAASMRIGDAAWEASSARARLSESGRLRISASRSSREGDVSQRESLTIVIDAFEGPGTYTASGRGSQFMRVGLDVGKAANAEDDDAAAEEALKALTGAKLILLTGLEIEITAASDAEIAGTFEWTPRAGSKNPPLRAGRFRAIVKQ